MFNVGDEVRGAGGRSLEISKGTIGVVEEYDGNDNTYWIDFANGGTGWFDENELVPAEGPEEELDGGIPAQPDKVYLVLTEPAIANSDDLETAVEYAAKLAEDRRSTTYVLQVSREAYLGIQRYQGVLLDESTIGVQVDFAEGNLND